MKIEYGVAQVSFGLLRNYDLLKSGYYGRGFKGGQLAGRCYLVAGLACF
jgi:hypothetical protein